MPRERVTVVAGGAVRLYEANGSGLVEYATILADLAPEDAAALTLALDGFLGARDRQRGGPVSVPLRASQRALPAPTNRPAGYLTAAILSALQEHPEGVRSTELAVTVDTTEASTRDCLYRLEKRGAVKRIQPGVFVLADAAAQPTGQKIRRATGATEEDMARILAYVEEHPGLPRQEIRAALGIEYVYFANRMATLIKRKAVRYEYERQGAKRVARVWKV